MFTKKKIMEHLIKEYEYTENELKKVGGRYNSNGIYEHLSGSNECFELLLDSIESEQEKLIQQEIYVISALHNNEIIMTIGCYPNKKNKFQINNFITKHFSKNSQIKNISMLLHSYASSLFDSKYIIVKEPLTVMRNILLNVFPNAIIIESDHHNYDHKKYEKKHENIIGCKYEDISYHGIGNYGESIIVEISDEFKNLYKSNLNITFTYTKVTDL